MKRAYMAALVWCVALFVLMTYAAYTFPIRESYHYVIHESTPLANFDGIHYLHIAIRGYVNEARFLPGYPLLIRLISLPFGTVSPWMGVAVSLASFAAALALIHRLIGLDHPKLRHRLLLSLMLFPTAFFFVSVYSESLFLLLAAIALYSARKKHWALATLGVVGASLTRLVGVALLVPVLWEWYHHKGTLRQLALLITSTVGIVGYGLYNAYTWGNPLQFVAAHGMLANGRSVTAIVNPLQTLYRYSKILIGIAPTQYEWSVALLELLAAAWVIITLIILWKRHVRTSYILYALACTLLPLLSGTWSGLPRYTLVAFPLLIPLAQIRSRIVFTLLLAISVAVQIILAVLFARGYFVA